MTNEYLFLLMNNGNMRIVSLAPSNTEILFALGVGEQIVGVTRFCDYPKDARNKEIVGGWVDPDYDKISRLKPDVIVTSSFVQAKVVERLVELGFNVLHVDPISLNDVYESFLGIGKAVGKKEKAEELVREMQGQLHIISQLSNRLGYVPRVYAEEWGKPPTLCGNWVPELIGLAGGKSLGKMNERSSEVSAKEVEEFDPDFVIVSWCGFGENVSVDLVRKRRGWEKIDAIAKNRIKVFDDSLLNRPGPRLAEGARKISKAVMEHSESRKDRARLL